MPKVRRVQSPSGDCTRSYPYPSPSKNVDLHKPMNLLGSVDDVKEWEEARCPICMETPHNTVLLKCSSHEVGCRPYMCNTSSRHSNCLDQFCKSFASHLSSAMLQEIPLSSTASGRKKQVQSETGQPLQCRSQLQLKLICPLCRGEIHGYMVLEPARRYMNSKPRGCSSEACEFQGTYTELREHARSEHPSVRPSDVDPSRQRNWIRLEQERDLEDLFSSIHAVSSAEYSRATILTWGFTDLMSLFYEILSMDEEANRMARLLVSSRHAVPLHDRRSRAMNWVSNNSQTIPSARWRSNLPSVHQPERSHTSRWRTNTTTTANDPERNRTARWRTNPSSSRMHRDVLQYCGEPSAGVRVSSTRMPRSLPQNIQTDPRGSISSSGRVPRYQLRWRDQRWSTYNNQP